MPQWGVGGRLLYLSSGGLFFFLVRVYEMFAVTKTAMHEAHGLPRGDVAFFAGSVQLPAEQPHWRVVLRFVSGRLEAASCVRVLF